MDKTTRRIIIEAEKLYFDNKDWKSFVKKERKKKENKRNELQNLLERLGLEWKS